MSNIYKLFANVTLPTKVFEFDASEEFINSDNDLTSTSHDGT